MQYKVVCFSALVFALPACFQVTPKGIAIACGPELDECSPDEQAIDAAAAKVTSLVGTTFDYSSIYILFNHGPVELQGRKYTGLTSRFDAQLNIQLIYTDCLFAGEGALVHELIHGALFIKTDNGDEGHLLKDEAWYPGLELEAELRAQWCPDYVPESE